MAASLPSHYGGETDGTWLLRPSLALSWQNERVYGDDVSGSAKLERCNKIEVTLIDYPEFICILRVITSTGNRTNRRAWLYF